MRRVLRGAVGVLFVITSVLVLGSAALADLTQDQIDKAKDDLSTAQQMIASGKLTDGQAKLDAVKAIAPASFAQRLQFAAALGDVVKTEQGGDKSAAAAALATLSATIAETDQSYAVTLVAGRLVNALFLGDTKPQAVQLVAAIGASPLKDQQNFAAHSFLAALYQTISYDPAKTEAELVQMAFMAKSQDEWRDWGVRTWGLLSRTQKLDDRLAAFGRLAPLAQGGADALSGLELVATQLLDQARTAVMSGDVDTGNKIVSAVKAGAANSQAIMQKAGLAQNMARARTLLDAKDYPGAVTALQQSYSGSGTLSAEEATVVYNEGVRLMNGLITANRQDDAKGLLNFLNANPGKQADKWTVSYCTADFSRQLGDLAQAVASLKEILPSDGGWQRGMIRLVAFQCASDLVKSNKKADAADLLALVSASPSGQADPFTFPIELAAFWKDRGDTALAAAALKVAAQSATTDAQKSALMESAVLVVAHAKTPEEAFGIYDTVADPFKTAGLAEGLLRKYLERAKAIAMQDSKPERAQEAMPWFNGVKTRAQGMKGLAQEVGTVEGLIAIRGVTTAGKTDDELISAMQGAYDTYKGNADVMRLLSTAGYGIVQQSIGVGHDKMGLAQNVAVLLARPEMIAAVPVADKEDPWGKWATQVRSVIWMGATVEEKVAVYKSLMAVADSPVAKKLLSEVMLKISADAVSYNDDEEKMSIAVAAMDAVRDAALQIPELASQAKILDLRIKAISNFKAKDYAGSLAAFNAAADLAKDDPAALGQLFFEGAERVKKLAVLKDVTDADAYLAALSRKELLSVFPAPGRPWTMLPRPYVPFLGVKAWERVCDEQMSKHAGEPDVLAFWMLANAYHKSLDSMERFHPREGISWAEKAVSTAASPSMRLAATCEVAFYYEKMNRCSAGISVLESVKGQYQGKDVEAINAVEQRLRATDATNKTTAAATQTSRKEIQKKGLLDYYRQQLAVAQAAGNQQEATKLQAAIAELEPQAKP